ncbi:MAG: hypothetical protein HY619_04080 [Thaumarchaeota archaeon]|nr:hypothetical protein [Nitrososphaerota archaeon]
MRISTPVSKFIIPLDVFERTFDELRKWGEKEFEGLVLWVGTTARSKAIIKDFVVPEADFWGGGVRISSGGMLKLAEDLSQRNLILLAQLHTHASDFGHSYGDEQHAASYRLGYVSIVVPNFAQEKHTDLSSCYVYGYVGNGKWNQLTKNQVARRFKIT